MKSSRMILLTILAWMLPTGVVSQGEELRFQRPGQSQEALSAEKVNQNFRAPSAVAKVAAPASAPAPVTAPRSTAAPVSAQRVVSTPQFAPASAKPLAQAAPRATKPVPIRLVQRIPDLAEGEEVDRPKSSESEPSSKMTPSMEFDDSYGGSDLPCDSCGMYPGGCGCEVGCGIADTCGMGICEPGCGAADPSCGVGVTDCGSCVGLPGPDYICFPVCIPRFKDLSFWGGVHGFRGPRDFYAPGSAVAGTRSDSNFGFQEGVNISGRAPFIGLLFPQLSYQLGYQAVQSRLSGTVNTSEDRSQQFVTAGFFRQVGTGLQFGAVWDMLRDDLYMEEDLHQIRYEVSLKSPQGREVGLWAANSTNTKEILGVPYSTVDQYNFFYRWNFGQSSNGRFWGGFTGDGDGIFGAEFNTPVNDRWSLQSGFNYLIPQDDPGLEGVSRESWNVGINLIWHLGRTARTCYRSPFRPMFAVADNGWVFVDRAGPNPQNAE